MDGRPNWHDVGRGRQQIVERLHACDRDVETRVPVRGIEMSPIVSVVVAMQVCGRAGLIESGCLEQPVVGKRYRDRSACINLAASRNVSSGDKPVSSWSISSIAKPISTEMRRRRHNLARGRREPRRR